MTAGPRGPSTLGAKAGSPQQRAESTVRRLYGAFQARDGAAMADCYTPGATFRDPVFADLQGRRVGAMWRMLTGSATDLRIEASGIAVDASGRNGRAHWEAWYTFGRTGRSVHNVIEATFTFDELGRIASHRDRFGFWRWSRKALGMPGILLGWTPLLRAKVRADARRRLDAFLAK